MAAGSETYLRRAARIVVLSLFGLLAGCAYHGDSASDLNNPAVQKFTWFSFLDGSDIRETCSALGPNAPARYRLVYNGQYEKQLRIYEIETQPPSGANLPTGGASLRARTKGGTNLANWWIQDSADLLAPWRWRESTAALSPEEMAQFHKALTESGFGSGAPQGLRLPSQDFYWVASGCEAGRFHFYAWRAKRGNLDAARFQDFLLRHDGTGLAFRKPYVLSIEESSAYRPAGGNNGRNPSTNFTVEVHGEGIGGLINAF
ncbi:hypothetical protein DLREEDagr8_04260 [Dongia sp. agr-C8]